MDTLTKEELIQMFVSVHHDWALLAASYGNGPKEGFWANDEMALRAQVLWTQVQKLINNTDFNNGAKAKGTAN